MPSLVNRAKDLWNRFEQSPTEEPGWVPIPKERVDEGDSLGTTLQANDQYFEIRINEVYLSYKRKWFTTYDPMVLIVSEFSYAGQPTIVPFVIGPTMVENMVEKSGNNGEAPQGMVFANTRVAGPHPYRGGDVALTVILYRSERQNYARQLLGLVENSAIVLDLVVPVGTYAKMAGLVLNGVETLTGTDGPVDPLMGRRDAFGPVKAGYFVLTSAPISKPEHLWVREKRLVQGPTLEEADSFEDDDYVLFSIGTTHRDDVSALPFFPTWQNVLQEAVTSSKKDIWENTKANMAALLGMIYTSPDLTETHKVQLEEEWTERMATLHRRAVRLSNLGGERQPAVNSSGQDRIRAKAVSVLNM